MSYKRKGLPRSWAGWINNITRKNIGVGIFVIWSALTLTVTLTVAVDYSEHAPPREYAGNIELRLYRGYDFYLESEAEIIGWSSRYFLFDNGKGSRIAGKELFDDEIPRQWDKPRYFENVDNTTFSAGAWELVSGSTGVDIETVQGNSATLLLESAQPSFFGFVFLVLISFVLWALVSSIIFMIFDFGQ